MIESRLLVAKLFAFLLNQSRSRLLYFSRSGAYTTAPLPRLASGKASTLLASLALACAKTNFRQVQKLPERSDPTEIPHIERSRGDHARKNFSMYREIPYRYTDRIDVHG